MINSNVMRHYKLDVIGTLSNMRLKGILKVVLQIFPWKTILFWLQRSLFVIASARSSTLVLAHLKNSDCNNCVRLVFRHKYFYIVNESPLKI